MNKIHITLLLTLIYISGGVAHADDADIAKQIFMCVSSKVSKATLASGERGERQIRNLLTTSCKTQYSTLETAMLKKNALKNGAMDQTIKSMARTDALNLISSIFAGVIRENN